LPEVRATTYYGYSALVGHGDFGGGGMPAHHRKLAVSTGIPDNRRRIIREHARHRGQVADVAIHDAEKGDDSGLIGRDRIKVMPTSA
jgi:hypothetical protein